MMSSNLPSTYGTSSATAGFRPIPPGLMNPPQMGPIVVQKPSNQNQQNQAGPRTKGQETGNHQILFNQRQGIPTQAFTNRQEAGSSNGQQTVDSDSTKKEKRHTENGEKSGETGMTITDQCLTHMSGSSKSSSRQRKPQSSNSSRRGSKSVAAGESGASTSSNTRRKTGTTSASSSSNSRTVRIKRQATGAIAQVAASTIPTSNVFQRKLQTYSLKGHWGRKDTKGVRWMDKVPEDEDPRKLNEIPVVPPHNTIEFTYWEPFNAKTNSTYLLFTSQGYRYWADAGAIRWLNAAANEGYTPANSIFVVKRTQGANDARATLSYGFKAYEEDDPIEVDSEDDAEMPDAKDAALDDDELSKGVPTPKMSDDEEEDKNEFD